MTFLELCKMVHNRAQVQGVFTSVTEVGINGEIAGLVRDSWEDIQKLRPRLLFMIKELSYTLSPTIDLYPLADLFAVPGSDDFARWEEDPGSLRLTNPVTGDQVTPRYRDFFDLRNRTLNSSDYNPDTPQFWTYHPQTFTIQLFPAPHLAFTVKQDYYRSPQILAVNNDTPHIRSNYHSLIAYKAISEFAAAKSFVGIHQRYELRYAQQVGELMREFNPEAIYKLNPVA